ncbi:TATA box-binding protein-like 1 isoform X2 [Syngnathus typhle]|uniref:TATA box-binding protein-like 1 isoform X2 n=1 Tax=Syngnathus typhle TaxID=161592 RepID=UPI002A69A643|nr:TATA box-binding protein-like 1 isoform X2 [Syngnathus typhle]
MRAADRRPTCCRGWEDSFASWGQEQHRGSPECQVAKILQKHSNRVVPQAPTPPSNPKRHGGIGARASGAGSRRDRTSGEMMGIEMSSSNFEAPLSKRDAAILRSEGKQPRHENDHPSHTLRHHHPSHKIRTGYLTGGKEASLTASQVSVDSLTVSLICGCPAFIFAKATTSSVIFEQQHRPPRAYLLGLPYYPQRGKTEVPRGDEPTMETRPGVAPSSSSFFYTGSLEPARRALYVTMMADE